MTAAPSADSPTRVAFQLERLEAGADGRLEVEGTWSGVRGMRFVRPALVLRVDGTERTLLAVLDHKPWDPQGRPWRAAFPWDGGELDPERAELAVAPSIVVPLAAGAGPVRADPQEVLRERLADALERVRHLEAEVAFLRRERSELMSGEDDARAAATAERDAARAERDALEAQRDAALRERDAARAELQERRRRLEGAERERRRAQADAEVERRRGEAAAEDHRAVEREREQADRERARVARELDAARVALDTAHVERDEAMARPAGVVPLAAIAQQRRAEHHEREAQAADWAARVAAIVAVLVLLVLMITFLKVV
jgi:uncharacterized protein YdaT